MLGIVLVLGKITRGANLYINLGFFSFQPSEFVKISFVLLIAVLLRERTDIKRVLLSAVIAAVHGIILVASRDLGAALIFFVSYLMMLYVATKQKAYLFIGLIVGFFACIAAYYLFAHVRVRVQTWLHPFADFTSSFFFTAASFSLIMDSFFDSLKSFHLILTFDIQFLHDSKNNKCT